MVKNTQSQVNLLAELKHLKDQQDVAMRQFELAVTAKREELKQPIKEAVARAQEAGISARQIALKGLGYADVGSLKQYLDTSNNGRMIVSQPFTFVPEAVSGPAGRTYVLREDISERETDQYEALLYVAEEDGHEAEVLFEYWPDGNRYAFTSIANRPYEKLWKVTLKEAQALDRQAREYLEKKYNHEFEED